MPCLSHPLRHLALTQWQPCWHDTDDSLTPMQLGLAADFAALALDKVTSVQAASRHADSVVAFVGKHLNV